MVWQNVRVLLNGEVAGVGGFDARLVSVSSERGEGVAEQVLSPTLFLPRVGTVFVPALCRPLSVSSEEEVEGCGWGVEELSRHVGVESRRQTWTGPAATWRERSGPLPSGREGATTTCRR